MVVVSIGMAPNPVTETSAWWENLIDLHPPKNEVVAQIMDDTRAMFKVAGEWMIENLPPSPDLTVALRSLKDASQHAIATIACNQEFYDD